MDNQDFYKNIKHINHALVEDIRPPMYKGFKYWGKKPHNIWREYINNYCKKGDIILDFFGGSGIACLEAIQIGRRTISIDLNPVSEFMIRFLVAEFNEKKFLEEFNKIFEKALRKEIKIGLYQTVCKYCRSNSALIINSKWNDDVVYEIGYECNNCKKRGLKNPDKKDFQNISQISSLKIPYWYPTKNFPDTSTFTASFLRKMGDSFDKLWTKRNLLILSFIYDEIKKVDDADNRTALLFAFISKLHLTTKMCVPRRSGANRPFSTSWGRSAYIAPSRQMEMNPLVIFRRACTERQGVLSVKQSTAKLLENKVKLAKNVNDFFKNKEKNLLLLTSDALSLGRILPKKSIDFIITDPPYAGLVQYLDLSSVWSVWLENYDKKYEIKYENEITINNKKDFNYYHRMLKKAFSEAYQVLKDDRTMVVTFHNDQIKIWNSLLRAVVLASFNFEKIIYQPNRRTGESNVANPYGTSASDYYLRYKKARGPVKKEAISSSEFERIVINVAKNIIVQRGEPTEKTFLLNAIYVELAQYGHYLEGEYEDVDKILEKHKNDIFVLREGTNEMLGSKWWLKDSQIKYPNLPLSDRVETAIIDKLRRDIRVSYDEILANIFEKFPNGLTPDVRNIKATIQEYAERDGEGHWRLKPTYQINEALHSVYIGQLAIIGKNLGFEVWIGTIEQGQDFNGKKLKDFVTNKELLLKGFSQEVLKRIKTIDVIWYKNEKIYAVFEVENSTSITSALERASHITDKIHRCIVIPNERKNFFARKLKEPLFNDYYSKDGWFYKFYEDVDLFAKKYAKAKGLNITKFEEFIAKKYA